MENFSNGITAILVVGFLLFALASGLVVQELGEPSVPAVHCEYHSQHMTCIPVGKAA